LGDTRNHRRHRPDSRFATPPGSQPHLHATSPIQSTASDL